MCARGRDLEESPACPSLKSSLEQPSASWCIAHLRVRVDTGGEEGEEPRSRCRDSSQSHYLAWLLVLASAELWVMPGSTSRPTNQPPRPSTSSCLKHHFINEQDTLPVALPSSQIGSCPLHPSNFHFISEENLLWCHPCRTIEVNVQNSSHCPGRKILQQPWHPHFQFTTCQVRILLDCPLNCVDFPASILFLLASSFFSWRNIIHSATCLS